MHRVFRIIHLVICLALIAHLLVAAFPAAAQDGGEEAFIAGLLPRLSPEAKIGQLFIVAFAGDNTALTSDIANLIRNYEVGGVVLSSDLNNLNSTGDAPIRLAGLTRQLQSLARTTVADPFVPLFVALRQNGDGTPNSEIVKGLTAVPGYMALGATWSPAQAETVGKIMGQELAAMGVNLLLGPVLDVRTQPSTSLFDPGVNLFGGDPYWVGVLGEAYARGLRAGAAERLAVTAEHFPGQGNLDDASFTVDRSLSDLAKIDLPPFERVMLNPTGTDRPLADALLTTNIRYRGFGGNIRERTAPISLDGVALQNLLQVPSVQAWRENGGLLISDAPGSLTAREYYSITTSGSYSVTRAALDAFQAGNDVLILDNLTPGQEAAQVRDVIAAFRQKYSTDPVFQQRVDSVVQRVLRLKYRLYPGYDFNQATVPLNAVEDQVNTGGPAVQQIAQEAVTLLWPPPDQIGTQRPGPDDTFLIAVDERRQRDCPTCPVVPTLSLAEVAQSLSRRYGVPTENITTTTYSALKDYLRGLDGAPDLTPDFESVGWIILAQQALNTTAREADAAQLLLDQRADLLAGKRVIGFMFGPPQGMTAQQLSRTDAWYVLYGKLTPNIEAAMQVLSGEQVPPGQSPVNLSDFGYDLTIQTEPEPDQVIALRVGEEAVPGQPTPAPVTLRVGDTARLNAGTIVDRNGHPVPDGTPVRFYIQADDAIAPVVQEAKTVNGVARTDLVLEKEGRLLIRAVSEPALTSTLLQVTISESGAVVATVAPTPTPTVTPIPTPTRTPTLTPTPTPTPTPSPMEAFLTRKPQNARWGELWLALSGCAVLSIGAYYLVHKRRADLGRALRAALWTAAGGLLGYVYFSLGWPGTEALRALFNAWAVLVMVFAGGILPLLYWVRVGPGER